MKGYLVRDYREGDPIIYIAKGTFQGERGSTDYCTRTPGHQKVHSPHMWTLL
jgi:hypothetical protein